MTQDIRCWCGQPAVCTWLEPMLFYQGSWSLGCSEHRVRIVLDDTHDCNRDAVLAAWNPPEPPEPEPEIKPCPFCGSGDIEVHSTADGVTHSVRCVEYGCCRSHAMSTRSLGDAVEHWNARVVIREEGPKMVRCWLCRGSGELVHPLSSRRLGDCPKCDGEGEVPA